MTGQAGDIRGPLARVRVIDLATVLAGPGIARHLADFGADVIKVERPGGETTRTMGWKAPGEDDSLFWKIVSRGKRAVVLNLKSDLGRAEFLKLAKDADIVVENMRPGRLERLGLGPLELHELNPALVIVRVSGFGQTGPYAERPGFATIAEAMSGFSNISGEPSGPPLLPPIALTDEVVAIVGAFAAVMALRHAEHTGQGQVVDVNLLESMLNLMGPLPAAYDSLGYLQPRMGSGIPYTVPRGTYQCRDGIWVALSASSESVASRVLTLLGLGEDTRFADFQSRSEHREELEARTIEWIAQRDSGEVLSSFHAADAAISAVYSMRDVVADEHIKDRESLIRVDGVLMQAPIAGLSLTPATVRWAGQPYDADITEITWADNQRAGRG